MEQHNDLREGQEEAVFKRNCTEADYKEWSPSAPGVGNRKHRCVLGKKEVYKRRAPSTDCYNGK